MVWLNFFLVILEYTTSYGLIKCEQKLINILKPEYNLNPQAGNSKGYIHSPESIEKMRSLALAHLYFYYLKIKLVILLLHKNKVLGCFIYPRFIYAGRKHSNEVKKLMSESRMSINHQFNGKKDKDEALNSIRNVELNRTKLSKPGVEVEITDIETKLTTTYESIRKAANAINSDIKSLSRREKSQLEKKINTPYRGIYIIVFKRS